MAKPKRIKIRTRIRTASKVQEKQLLNTGKWLSKNPEALIPKCEDKCRKCDFEKIRSRLIRASEMRDNERILRALSKRGPQLSRAYAATLLQTKLERASYLMVAKGPDGNIAYMQSPKVKKEALIGVQYFNDPHLRLLAYTEISRKRKLAFYSVGESIYCAPISATPPDAFIKEISTKLSLQSRDGNSCKCSHDLKEKGFLRISWKNTDVSLSICNNCLGERNSIVLISERMITPSLERQFSISASVHLECDQECDSCPGNELFEFEQEDVRKYITGAVSDRDLYKIATDKFLSKIRKSTSQCATRGINCYGRDKDRLAAAIATDEFELQAVKTLFSKLDFPIVLPEDITTNKLLSQYWTEYGKAIISDIIGEDVKELPELNQDSTPLSIIERFRQRKKSKLLEDSLPRYSELGVISSFADKLARECKIKGKDSALKLAMPSGHEETRLKSVGLAFRIALNETGMNWQYSKEEIDYANHLASYAKKLLESNGEKYDSALRELTINAGAEERIIKSG